MESLNFAKGEKLLRCKLAAVYRLIDMHGWTQSIYNHVTVGIVMVVVVSLLLVAMSGVHVGVMAVLVLLVHLEEDRES